MFAVAPGSRIFNSSWGTARQIRLGVTRELDVESQGGSPALSSPRSLVEEFLLGRALYVSAATVKGDDWYLSRFFGFLEAQGVVEVQAIREDHLSRYQHHLNEAMNRFGRPVSKSYVYRAVMVAKMFLVWAKGAGFHLFDFSSFRLEKPTRKPVVVPGVNQVALLLEAPNVETPEGLRDRLIFRVLLHVGSAPP